MGAPARSTSWRGLVSEVLDPDRDSVRLDGRLFSRDDAAHVHLLSSRRRCSCGRSGRPRRGRGLEPNRHHVAAVLGNGLPAELNDLTESLGVFAPTELEPFGGDPVLVGRCRARLELGVSPGLERGRQAETGARGDLAHLHRRLQDLRAALCPQLADHPPALVQRRARSRARGIDLPTALPVLRGSQTMDIASCTSLPSCW